MASANSQRPIPNFEIYDFDTAFESAFAQSFVAHNLVKPDETQGVEILSTPRVECKFSSGQQEQRSYLVPGTLDPTTNFQWAYQNQWNGVMELTVITNRLREKGKEHHRQIRCVVRWIMQDHQRELTSRMKYLTVIQTLETSTQTSFDNQTDYDASKLNYAIRFNIHGAPTPSDPRPSAFPVPS